jgi:hypothetical protein
MTEVSWRPLSTRQRGAQLSPDRVYRYLLWRATGTGPTVLFVGLNPSTADEQADDPAIRRCVGFAVREGYGMLEMANLYALRATDPRALRWHRDPVGPDNDAHLLARATAAAAVILAWGAVGREHAARVARVMELLRSVERQVGRPLLCLGTTKAGAPRHPLYLRADCPLVPYAEAI